MRKLLFILAFTFGTSFAFTAQKYGYIDSDFILNKMSDYNEAKSKLDKLAEKWTADIEMRYSALK